MLKMLKILEWLLQIKELEAQLAKERKARAICETKLREHQRQSEKLPEKKASLEQIWALIWVTFTRNNHGFSKKWIVLSIISHL